MYLLAKHCPAEYEASVANFAQHATISQLSQSLRNYAFGEDSEPAADEKSEQPPRPPSQASISFGPDGRFRFTATGDAEEGGRLKAALDQYHTRLVGERHDDEPYPIDAETLANWSTGRRPGLHLGPVVNRSTMELLTCEGDVTMLVTRFGRPVRLGRSVRVVPTWLRDVIIDRDGGCRVSRSPSAATRPKRMD